MAHDLPNKESINLSEGIWGWDWVSVHLAVGALLGLVEQCKRHLRN
jgi:hypothetical protein